MRLEEAQRWLDSQFLDDKPAPKPEAKPESVLRVGTPPAAQAMEPPASAVESASPETKVEEKPEPDIRPKREPETEPKTFPIVQAAVPPPNSSQPAPVAPAPIEPIEPRPRPAVSFGTVGEELEVPTLDKYLPFLRKREPEPETPVVKTEESKPPAGAENASLEETATTEQPVAQSISEQPSVEAQPGAGRTSEISPSLLESIAATNRPTQEELAALNPPPQATKPAARRYGISHKRARHARNVRPIEVVQEMDAEAVWSLAPKHVQTLLALESDEVAQNSYSRQFKESRLELLRRLLDPTLSLEETARLLNVCPTTVRRYTNRGLLTHQRTAGDQRRFKLSDVLAFLEAQSRSR